ncbi:allophanate hydrolase [Micromonospora sp. NBC_01796]|uniref:allophanate hydrolase n=1 Tax=Micromonospora sp. NBC_01796 TaxID=2975987 RepID=UPI002DD8C113|nr:allophanate hydrolase [Micromonospora sp. NBC_01796]WSA89305.1 allophanate hydrolase [Micromonospora sp. NBC_01796]
MAAPTSPLTDLRQAYTGGRRTTVDTVEQVLTELAREDDRNVWISTVPPAELRARAADLHRMRDRMDRLPLYGVPFAVKDNIDVAGLPTTAGCPEFAYLPERTAPVVRRLLDAGAILVGKTNLDQFATGLTGSRSPYGRVESVFGGGLVAGGSSSGSAVAVAAGSVTFALGTDTAGSGRVPAALNGIVGLKPTRGLLSTSGVVPACRSLDCVSVFTAEVTDAVTVLEVARGVDAEDPWSRPLPAHLVEPRDPATLRLGLPPVAQLDFFGDQGQADRYAHSLAGLTKAVAGTSPIDPVPLLEAGDLLYQGPWVAERLATLDGFLRARPDALLPVTRTVLESGRRFDAVDTFRALHRLQELRAWTDRLWERVDVLVLPTIGTTFTLAEIAEEPIARNLVLGRYTQFVNLLDLAAVTIPNGFTADGRPASLTLIGPAFSDTTLARLAAAITAPDQPAVAPAPPANGSAVTPERIDEPALLVAVVGRHLTGESHNGELVERGAVLAGTAYTAPLYRLYRLPTPDGTGLPGLVRVSTTGHSGTGVSIEVELWRLPPTALGGLLDGVPAPLGLGRLRLTDGREVLGFLCESYAAGAGTEDISATGGWRAYRRTVASTTTGRTT